MRQLALGALCLAGACVVLPARAEIGLDASAAQAHYRAVERFANGSIADTEAGTLEGGRVGVWWGAAPCQLGLDLGHMEASVQYRGRSQAGFPIRTHSRIGLDETALQGRWRITGEGAFHAELTGALGLRRIDRRISPTLLSTPLTEVMRWRFAQLGARARWSFGDGWFATGKAHIEQGLGARLAVDFHGVADPVQLKPRHGRTGHHVELALGRALPHDTSLSLRASQARHYYGASSSLPYTRNGLANGQVHYPGSTQRHDEVALVFELNWP